MATERNTPFAFSETAIQLQDGLSPAEFFEHLRNISASERMSFVRLCVQERNPQGFSKQPFLWESVREWISRRHNLTPRQIGLAGSAQLGFSTSPDKQRAQFNPQGSDLDLFIVDTQIFEKVATEARLFVANAAAQNTFSDQASTTQKTLRRGYVNLNQIPANHERYKTCAVLRNDASIVIDKLQLHGFSLKPSNFRIYENWAGLAEWTSIQANSWAKNNSSPT